MLADLATPALVLAGPGTDLGPAPEGVTYGDLAGAVPEGSWTTVLLAVADEGELRTAASTLPDLGRAKHVACRLTSAAGPVTTVLRPEWPPLANLVAETPDGGALTRMTFRRPAPAAAVLVELARHTGTPVVTGNHGLVVSGVEVPMDPTAVTEEVPAAVVTGAATRTDVLARQPVVVDSRPRPAGRGVAQPGRVPPRLGPRAGAAARRRTHAGTRREPA